LQSVEEALAAAQRKAENLFAEVVATGLIQVGLLESELSKKIHQLANRRFGVRRQLAQASRQMRREYIAHLL